MPIYEYQCQSCGERREVLQRMSDAPLKTCDECGGEVRKLISAPAFQFKGSGWYVTDYARKGDPGEGGTAEKPATNGDSAGDKSTESQDVGRRRSRAPPRAPPRPPRRRRQVLRIQGYTDIVSSYPV